MLKSVGSMLATLASAISRSQGTSALANLTFVGSIPAEVPVYATLDDNDLHITGFRGSNQENRVYEAKNISEAVRAGIANIRPKQLDAVRWPSAAPLRLWRNEHHRDNLVDTKTGNSTTVSVSDSNRFYHHVQWPDVDNDGLLDIVTAGTKREIVGEGTSEEERVLHASLYWLKQPASNPLGQHWEQTKVIDGPGMFFSIEGFNDDGNLDLLASQFFNQKLVLYTELTWSDPSVGFHAKVIDDTIGPVAHAVTADLNGDGRKEVVVTSRGVGYFAVQSESENTTIFPLHSAGVFAYKLPSFAKHVLASGYQSSRYITTPEVPVIVKLTADSNLPVVIMGGGKAYILAPRDNAFNYDLYTIFEDVNMRGVGQICAGDVDGDGKAGSSRQIADTTQSLYSASSEQVEAKTSFPLLSQRVGFTHINSVVS